MAVVIKNAGFRNIKIYTGGIIDWQRSGLPLLRPEPLPVHKKRAITAQELLAKLTEAEKTKCRNTSGLPLMTFLDLRVSDALCQRIGGDKYTIKTSCTTLAMQLDSFIDNPSLVQSLADKGLVITFTETGKRDIYLQRYLKKKSDLDFVMLDQGIRSWIKAGFPVENNRE